MNRRERREGRVRYRQWLRRYTARDFRDRMRGLSVGQTLESWSLPDKQACLRPPGAGAARHRLEQVRVELGESQIDWNVCPADGLWRQKPWAAEHRDYCVSRTAHAARRTCSRIACHHRPPASPSEVART